MQFDMTGFMKKVKKYAVEDHWNRHEIDMLEEIEELLELEVPLEQKHRELKRVEHILKEHQKQGLSQAADKENEYKEKEHFLFEIQDLLTACEKRLNAITQQQLLTIEPEFEILKRELQDTCNAGANWRSMKSYQDFRTLFMSKTENFNSRLKAAASPFSQEISQEYDSCFDRVKTRMINTSIESFHTTEKEWYEKSGQSKDLLHSQIQAEADSIHLEGAPFEAFATKCGNALEQTFKKHQSITRMLYLIPLALYLIKYILETYLFKKESLQERLVNMLLERMVKNGEDTTEGILNVMQNILPLIKENKAAGLGINLVLALIFFGWLYFLYYIIVKRVRKSSQIRSLGRCAQQQLQEFTANAPWKQACTTAFENLSQQIQKLYRKHYEFVNQKLVLKSLEETEEKPDMASMLLAEYQSWGG